RPHAQRFSPVAQNLDRLNNRIRRPLSGAAPMETLLNRYRNISVLLLAIFAQLLLLAYQVRSAEDVPMIRVWAVSAVTPLAKVLEVVRSGTVGFVQSYI